MSDNRLAFGPFVLDAQAGALFRRGAPIAPSYRGLLLLAAMARKPGEVLEKAELMEAAWPDLAVEESNLTVQIASLRKLLGPAPDGSEWIVTVPRIGYRLAASVAAAPAGAGAAIEPRDLGPSIAVLPFADLAHEAGERHFANGLAEDIIMRLARLRWLFVSARNASFAYEGSAVDSRQVGRELGVRYVLEGSVRRSAGRVRANALLSDAATGLQVWADRYDVSVAEFFELQDQISKSVIAAVEPRLFQHEHERFRARPPESLDAWGYLMQAMPYIWTWGSAADIEAAQQLLSKALLVDPDYPRAHSFLAWTNAARVQLGWAPDHNVLATALAMAQRAVASDTEDPWPHCALGYVYMVSRGFDRAVEELMEAIELNPSFTLAHVILGCAYGYGGMANDGLHHLGIARHLSPRDFAQAANLATTGLCCFIAGRFSEGVGLLTRAVELRPHFGSAWRTLAAAAGKAGDLAMALRALGEARRLQPGISVEWVEKWHPIVHARDRAIYIEGLRAAGLT